MPLTLAIHPVSDLAFGSGTRLEGTLLRIDKDELTRTTPSDLHWMARNQVVFYGMGFAETYLMRSPIESATEAQAEAIIDEMRKMPTLYERVER